MSIETEHAHLYTARPGGTGRIVDYPNAELRIWKPHFNFAPWPIWQMMWVSCFKILYTPIAKNACTSLKSLLVRLAMRPHERGKLESEVHGWLDNTNTGLQLGDLAEQSLSLLLNDPGAARVVVVRDPFDRLVSAYLEKFVASRSHAGTRFHTRSVIAAVNGMRPPGDADFSRSITFRQFVEHIVAQPSERLDPHWCPQMRYLGGLKFNHIYDLDDLQPLVEFFRSKGVPEDFLNIPHLNRNRTQTQRVVPDAMDRPASSLEGLCDVATSSFYDERLERTVGDYYREDIALLAAAIRS